MKKILSATCAMMLASAGMMANAQQEQTQLPNGTFDGAWVDCKPDGSNVVGTQPEGWMASNVYKKVFIFTVKLPLVFQDENYTGASENAFSVKMENLFAESMGIGANAPGYITLGTSWAYGDIANVSNPEKDTSDGGAYGGIQFEYRPDALSLWVKRTHGTENPDERASVIFYSWKGHTTSRVKTGLSNAPVEIDMVDREKDVLGMIQDGVTKSEDFELISKSENYVEGDIADWKQVTYPIDYLSNGTPEKINVILSSSDYFNRKELGLDNKFWVDDVRFVYYSRLASISLNEEAVTLKEGQYDYTLNKVLDFSEEDIAEAVKYTLEGKSQSANVSVSVEAENAVVKVVVSNVDADIDGEKSHTYTFKYQKPEVEPVIEEYDGYLNVEMNGGQIEQNTPSKIEIHDYQNGYCTFLLPNLIIGGELPLGDIRIDNVVIKRVEGGNSYTGTVDDMVLHNDFLGDIHAKVELNGTIIGSEVKMDVDVIWYSDYPNNTHDAEIPIKVSFTSAKLSGVESVAGDGVKVYAAAGCVVVEGAEGVAQVYTADGKQVAAEAVKGKTEIALTNGLYIVRVGNKVQKVVVK